MDSLSGMCLRWCLVAVAEDTAEPPPAGGWRWRCAADAPAAGSVALLASHGTAAADVALVTEPG